MPVHFTNSPPRCSQQHWEHLVTGSLGAQSPAGSLLSPSTSHWQEIRDPGPQGRDHRRLQRVLLRDGAEKGLEAAGPGEERGDAMCLDGPTVTNPFDFKTTKNLSRITAPILAGTAGTTLCRTRSIFLLAVGTKTPQDLATASANPQEFTRT